MLFTTVIGNKIPACYGNNLICKPILDDLY